MTNKNILIIIINYNNASLTLDCLKSFYRQSELNKFKFKLLLIDNNSLKSDYLVLKHGIKDEWSNLILKRKNKNLGFAKANNWGINYAIKKGINYVFLLNNDVYLPNDFLKKFIPQAIKLGGFVCPVIKFYKNPQEIWYAGGYFNWIKGGTTHLKKIKKNTPYRTKFASGCAMFSSVKNFIKIGKLPENYFLYFEDAELSIKALENNIPIWVISFAEIYHKVSSSTKIKSNLYRFYFSRNRIIFMKRNSNFIKRLLFFFFLFFVKLPFLLFYFGTIEKNLNKFLIYLKGTWQGIKSKEGKAHLRYHSK